MFVILIGAAFVLEIVIFAMPIPLIASVIAIIVLLCSIVGFSTKYYTYLLLPALRMKGRAIVLNADEPFIMSPSGNAIVIREGDSVYASSFVRIPIYRSATEMVDEEKAAFASMFGRLLTSTTEPVKLSAQMYIINKDDYINKIKARLNAAEERYSRLIANKTVDKGSSERIRGEVTMWRNLFENLSSSRSQALLVYGMVSAMGGSEEEAVNLAYQKAEEFAAGASAVLGVNAYIVRGDEILTLIEPNYMIPVETVSERIMQKNVEEAI
jgi:hypothetical protein